MANRIQLSSCDDEVSLGEPIGRTSALKEMIDLMKGHEGVWFATDIEIAEWWLEQSFLETPEPLSAAVASNFQSRSIPHYFLSKKI
jgi:hypothetical protein